MFESTPLPRQADVAATAQQLHALGDLPWLAVCVPQSALGRLEGLLGWGASSGTWAAVVGGSPAAVKFALPHDRAAMQVGQLSPRKPSSETVSECL